MLSGITPKCWILALVVRDDGERILLGDGAFDFKEKQQHFVGNNYVNDTVEVQGNDGVMLAGQVRRSAAQSFDGYIADGTVGKTKTEECRRQFLSFFRKNHFYTVIYILPDGSAVKRQRGFIVDDPEVKELWQISPEYHVSLNFEDINYYSYAENAEGEEIYSSSATIPLVSADGGGLVWDGSGVVWEKNLFNPQDYSKITNAYFDGDLAISTITSVGGTRNLILYISCEGGKDYSVKMPKIAGLSQYQVGTTEVTPEIGTQVVSLTSIKMAADNINSTALLTTPNGANYIAIRIQTVSGVAISSIENTIVESLLIERGFGGAVWEGGGGGGVVDVSVNSIDNVYPVLTISGPANNPTIENVTTRTSISYAGNVAIGQALKIDMNSQTATINGTSVIADISGNWLYFAPGVNKVAYSANNNDAPDAKIEWSEVVG